MKEGCRQTLERAYLILDGEEITSEERVTIQEHLEACEPCFERYGLEVEVKRVIARLRGCTTCPDELKAKITTLLDQA
jgi:mycothiol system anti-sigma-R factor